MARSARLITLLLAATMLPGCGGDSSSSNSNTDEQSIPLVDARPVERPATLPTTNAVVPSATVLHIEDIPVAFPPLHARVQPGGNGLAVLIYSEDPADSSPTTRPTDHPNSLYLDMSLDAADLSQRDGAAWHFAAAGDERSESFNAIVIDHGRRILQPFDVTVTLYRRESRVFATIAGEFLSFSDPDSPKADKTSAVRGTVSAIIDPQ